MSSNHVLPSMRHADPHRADADPLTRDIIGAAIKVHKELGPGLLESVYRRCLAFEMAARSIPFDSEVALPVYYCGNLLDCGFRIDLLVCGLVIVE